VASLHDVFGDLRKSLDKFTNKVESANRGKPFDELGESSKRLVEAQDRLASKFRNVEKSFKSGRAFDAIAGYYESRKSTSERNQAQKEGYYAEREAEKKQKKEDALKALVDKFNMKGARGAREQEWIDKDNEQTRSKRQNSSMLGILNNIVRGRFGSAMIKFGPTLGLLAIGLYATVKALNAMAKSGANVAGANAFTYTAGISPIEVEQLGGVYQITQGLDRADSMKKAGETLAKVNAVRTAMLWGQADASAYTGANFLGVGFSGSKSNLEFLREVAQKAHQADLRTKKGTGLQFGSSLGLDAGTMYSMNRADTQGYWNRGVLESNGRGSRLAAFETWNQAMLQKALMIENSLEIMATDIKGIYERIDYFVKKLTGSTSGDIYFGTSKNLSPRDIKPMEKSEDSLDKFLINPLRRLIDLIPESIKPKAQKYDHGGINIDKIDINIQGNYKDPEAIAFEVRRQLQSTLRGVQLDSPVMVG
jgi:hypothetical protein